MQPCFTPPAGVEKTSEGVLLTQTATVFEKYSCWIRCTTGLGVPDQNRLELRPLHFLKSFSELHRLYDYLTNASGFAHESAHLKFVGE